MIGVVPTAGEGTRLRPLTADTPKGLVEVGGRPLLAHVFDTLLDSGVTELVVIIGYEGGQILQRFGDSYDGVQITYVHQRDQRGLGHAVQQAAPIVGDEPIVVLNGDNAFGGPVPAILEAIDDDEIDAVVAVERTDFETARTTGTVVIDTEYQTPTASVNTLGRVTDIVEKPEEPASRIITTGLYVLPPAIFQALSICQPGPRGEIELPDAIDVLCRAGYDVAAVELPVERVNVNTQSDRQAAERLCRDR